MNNHLVTGFVVHTSRAGPGETDRWHVYLHGTVSQPSGLDLTLGTAVPQCVLGTFGTRARRANLTLALLHARYLGSTPAGLGCISGPPALGLLPAGLNGWTHSAKTLCEAEILFQSQGTIHPTSGQGEKNHHPGQHYRPGPHPGGQESLRE